MRDRYRLRSELSQTRTEPDGRSFGIDISRCRLAKNDRRKQLPADTERKRDQLRRGLRGEHMVVARFDEEFRAGPEIHATTDVVTTAVWIDIAAERIAGGRTADTDVPEGIAGGGGNRASS